MKYTAKPVTQNARKAAKPTPLKDTTSTTTDANTKIVKERKTKDGLVYDVTTESGNSSSDANALKNVSAPANDLGKAKGGRQAKTAAEKSSYSDWVTKQISSGKQSAQHMADQGYISKDRVGEYAKHAPKQEVNTSANSKSSSKETWTPVMTEAVAPKTQVQTRAHEKRSSNRQWITSNMVNRVAASSQIRRAKRDGLFANGELTDKGRSSLSPERQKGLMGAWDTKRGRSADQLAHTNRTGVWANGGNTHAGESFETEEGKASEHMRASGGKNKSGGALEGTQVANNAATRVKSTFGDFSSTQTEADRIMAGVNKGTPNGVNEALANAAAGGPEVSTRPQTRKEKRAFNKDRRQDAKEDRQAKRQDAKATRQDARADRQATRKANKAVRVAERGVKAAGGADAVQSGKIFDDAGQAPKTSLVKPPSNEVKISARPRPEAKVTEQTWKAQSDSPDGTATVGVVGAPGAHSTYSDEQHLKDTIATNKSKPAAPKYKMSRLHSSKSPAKMWGPSKVKAGKDGFNRKK